jgi:hypothetical protein
LRPTRIITYAWGERYVDELLTLTLPALLAPGNLPDVAARVPCKFVLLTEKRLFRRIKAHPSIRRIRELCDVQLLPLDDLLVLPGSYGMSLTYILHRGLTDIGPAMTEQWQIFLNADFVLADGSLRNLLSHLARGERIIAAPSYCTNAEEVIPELRELMDPLEPRLTLAPRDMARLILRYRHNSIRGKTMYFKEFHHRYRDQFYCEADADTLLGLQMPVAIVGLVPERYLPEPTTFWDYGMIREYCPTANIHVIGDSNEFLMMELRSKASVDHLLDPGPPNPQELAHRMVGWVTAYQRDFAIFPLILHAADIPEVAQKARADLRAYTDSILSHTPAELPSHLNHPQWVHHAKLFQWARAIASRPGGRLYLKLWILWRTSSAHYVFWLIGWAHYLLWRKPVKFIRRYWVGLGILCRKALGLNRSGQR